MASTSTNPEVVALNLEIAQLGEKIKAMSIAKEPVADEIVQLKDLKAKLAILEPPVKKETLPQLKGVKQAENKLILKVPKGTKDFHPTETRIRRRIFATLESVFLNHGAVSIDTPVFELTDILTGKYGEDSKLIYDLKDQGGEQCSLRYDLTVPFARHVAMSKITEMKRYHIAKVYRRDQPAMSKGRLREFYQCDFDIAGSYDQMIPDAEILAITVEALTKLEIGDFTIKVNHRKILDGIFSLCGVPAASLRPISSAVDKLDKAPWSEVRREMIEEKNLDPAVADKIGHYVKFKGRGPELLAELEKDEALVGNKIAKEGLQDMKLLFDYLEVFDVVDKISFDLSLARGLDYYTGLIYEAVTELSAPPPKDLLAPAQAPTTDGDEFDETTVGVGSVAAGGRYDELVGNFSRSTGAKGKAVHEVPCVGISVGVERIYAILIAKAAKEAQGDKGRGKETEVYVMSVGDGLVKERMKICKELWDAGIKAEFFYKKKPKNVRIQFDIVDRDQIPFAVIVGGTEIEGGTVRVKDQSVMEGAPDANGELIPRAEMISYIKKKLSEQQ